MSALLRYLCVVSGGSQSCGRPCANVAKILIKPTATREKKQSRQKPSFFEHLRVVSKPSSIPTMSDFDLSGRSISLADRDTACGFSSERDIGGHVQATELRGTQPDARDVIRQHLRQEEATKRRKALLRLHDDSLLDVERYTLGVLANQIIPPQSPFLHAPLDLSGAQKPDAAFRVQRVTSNVPCPGFTLLFTLKLGNVTSIVSNTGIDAWQVNANAWEEEMDLPTLTPENAMSFVGKFTGIVVTPFNAQSFQFALAGSGPAEKVPFGEDLSPSDPF